MPAASQAHYALLFEEGPELAAEVGSLVFTGTTDDPETLDTLKRLGFATPRRRRRPCAAGISAAARPSSAPAPARS